MDKFNLTDALKNFDEEEECDFIPIEEFQPYLDREFKTWLVSERVLSEKSANEYLINCRNAYYSLYDLVEIDLAKLLQAYLTDIPDKTGSDFSREASIELVNKLTFTETTFKLHTAFETCAAQAEQVIPPISYFSFIFYFSNLLIT